MSQQADLDERVKAIEQLIGQVLLRARTHPIGLKILRILGLE